VKGRTMTWDYPLDWYDVLERCAQDEDLVDALVETFLTDSPGHVEALRQAATAGDAPQVRSVAHMLKGSAGAIGAKPLAAAMLAMEKAAAEGNMTAAASALEAVQDEFERLQAFLAEPDWKDRIKAAGACPS